MRRCGPILTLLGSALLAATAGCSSSPGRYVAPIATPVAAPAYVQAEVIGGYEARAKKARAAKVKALGADSVADFVSRAEIDLRRQTAGTGVDVIRSGERILLRVPANLTFDSGKADIKPQAYSTLTEIALTLKRFDQSLVDVLGHTDSTGAEPTNLTLSQRRADAVAAYLRNRGVGAGRIAAKGFGEAHPIADNGNDEGRAANRRVEIRVVPLR